MNPLFKALLALALILLGTAGQVSANFVTNGSFEAVQIGFPYVSSNPADIPGWTHSGAVGDGMLWAIGYSDGGGSVTVAGEGKQFVTLGSGYFQPPAFASWQQTMTGLTPGQTYTLTFKMADEGADTGSPSQSITVDFPSGSSTGAQIFSATNPGTNYWREWETKTENFVATSSSVTLRFSVNQSFDVGLDAVSVVPATPVVPEPATLSLGMCGVFSLLGASWWRRRRNV